MSEKRYEVTSTGGVFFVFAAYWEVLDNGTLVFRDEGSETVAVFAAGYWRHVDAEEA